MVLNLNKEISASKNVKILKSGFFCAFVIVGGKIARNLARKAGRKRNYTLVIFSKQFFIYSWLLIESVNKSGRNKLNKIFISGVVFAKKNKVITPIKLMLFAETRAVGNINFASDYRFYIIFLCFFIKINNAVHNAVVGYGNGILSKLTDSRHKALYAAGAVKKAVFGVEMKMYKAHFCAFLLLKFTRSARLPSRSCRV